ncbi:hypothetical protein HT031_005456 [Scenedesmus sp. PABB004]|nr:hypothetical protein HT031_005456 [Scenedesmus sp. PABB004]
MLPGTLVGAGGLPPDAAQAAAARRAAELQLKAAALAADEEALTCRAVELSLLPPQPAAGAAGTISSPSDGGPHQQQLPGAAAPGGACRAGARGAAAQPAEPPPPLSPGPVTGHPRDDLDAALDQLLAGLGTGDAALPDLHISDAEMQAIMGGGLPAAPGGCAAAMPACAPHPALQAKLGAGASSASGATAPPDDGLALGGSPGAPPRLAALTEHVGELQDLLLRRRRGVPARALAPCQGLEAELGARRAPGSLRGGRPAGHGGGASGGGAAAVRAASAARGHSTGRAGGGGAGAGAGP